MLLPLDFPDEEAARTVDRPSGRAYSLKSYFSALLFKRINIVT